MLSLFMFYVPDVNCGQAEDAKTSAFQNHISPHP